MKKAFNILKLSFGILLLVGASVYVIYSIIQVKLLGIIIVAMPMTVIGSWLFQSGSEGLKQRLGTD